MTTNHLYHRLTCTIALLLATACSRPTPNANGDSTEVVIAPIDSVTSADSAAATALCDSAKAVLAKLLDNPASASFDSLIVVQPPLDGDRRPSPVVCGRIGGRPGIGGSTSRKRFVYQNRWTVFVEENANREQFADLWGRTCAPGSGTVILHSPDVST